MIYGPCDEGNYLFLYDKAEDAACAFDHHHASLQEAEEAAMNSGATGAWEMIPDPLEDAQHDWIQPTRVKRTSDGMKLLGQFEKISEK